MYDQTAVASSFTAPGPPTGSGLFEHCPCRHFAVVLTPQTPVSHHSSPMKTITSFVVRTIGFCIHYPWSVTAAAIIIAIASVWYTAGHFSVNTDINQLLSANSPGRQREMAFEKAFPQFDLTIAVVEAPTPELVQEASSALVAKLKPEKNFFVSVDEPQGGPVFCSERPFVRDRRQLDAADGDVVRKRSGLCRCWPADPSSAWGHSRPCSSGCSACSRAS